MWPTVAANDLLNQGLQNAHWTRNVTTDRVLPNILRSFPPGHGQTHQPRQPRPRIGSIEVLDDSTTVSPQFFLTFTIRLKSHAIPCYPIYTSHFISFLFLIFSSAIYYISSRSSFNILIDSRPTNISFFSYSLSVSSYPSFFNIVVAGKPHLLRRSLSDSEGLLDLLQRHTIVSPHIPPTLA